MRVDPRKRWAALALVAACGATVQAGSLIAPSDSPDVALVFTGDVIG
ncbi:MAG: hypothetical protein GTN89_06785, partial [Acidobacteria bacterium]|nr:hypothetical protein [Acidobacteriota bacterium]NIM60866.1 hypothetical protein [Acidobacteriota bacterium]NIO59021.1 hypothetical protein [Acidobacteriota bacterium]NIQ30066.1 hypothetical protein [Acidobacteriota bacterium]NIQ84853.1 hypothetical protein [Acidobacteriota bacterium]